MVYQYKTIDCAYKRVKDSRRWKNIFKEYYSSSSNELCSNLCCHIEITRRRIKKSSRHGAAIDIARKFVVLCIHNNVTEISGRAIMRRIRYHQRFIILFFLQKLGRTVWRAHAISWNWAELIDWMVCHFPVWWHSQGFKGMRRENMSPYKKDAIVYTPDEASSPNYNAKQLLL